MKLKRLLLTVDLLPTINEIQEACPVLSPQSMEDYVDSIRELAQPTSVHGNLVRQTQRPRLSARSMRRGTFSSPSHVAVRPHKLGTPILLDDIGLHLLTRRGCRSLAQVSGDPVDWLFAQTQTEDSLPNGKTSADLSLM
ncbi:protein DEPP-like [Scleropages formosus]|uniref:Protein DEPP-like n=1 Tax=Scleropages formosus TaxID=113540 RepID=A0A0P7THG3_SCLFO|nr:protein DEPP-like [Scleropages formosus]